MRNPLITYEWNHKLFSSPIRLWELSRVGAINVTVDQTQYGAHYSYYSLDGAFIARYYKDDTFGHGSQATGVELKDAIPDVILPDSAECLRTGSIRLKSIN